IVRMTSKGQLTLPVGIRKHLSLRKGSYLYAESLGGLVILKKVEELTLEDISRVLERVAEERGTTQKDLEEEIERIRAESAAEETNSP
ncbi:MAG: AbrB/MazE/SpoVT family DNA-binding domain-containing protein, partial [Candidatus Geothermarchaeales archaeon]